MRICHVSLRSPPTIGGMTNHVAGLAREQATLGHEVHVIAGEGGAPLDGVRIHLVGGPPEPKGRSAGWWRRSFYARVAKALAGQPLFDVINLHGGLGDLVLGGRALARCGPVVFTNHAGYTPSGLRRRLLAHTATTRLAGIISTSPEMHRVFAECGVPAGKLRTVPAGVGAAFFELGRTRNGPASARRVLCVGRLDPMKGQEDLADAARLLHPRVPFELDFVGEGDAVALQHKSSGLPVRVRGGLGAPEYEALLAAADVVVVPSRVLARHGLRESSPIVVGEAMAAGVPVVATRTGGIPDLIVDGQTGLLVEPNSPPNLAQAIERLLVSATLRAELARNGRRAVAARAWPAVAKATLDAYDAFVPA